MHLRGYFLNIILSCFSVSICFAQDNQYSTQQFGGRSAMLGGAVIAGVDDNSAVFYNPGALAFVKTPSLSVNANLYKVSVLRIRDAAGQELDLSSIRFSLYPTMLSALVRFKKNDRFVGSFALITRHFGNEKTQLVQESFYDIYPQIAGDEEFIGSFEYESRIYEQWGGFGFGYRINEHWSAGVSQFVSYRSLLFRYNVFSRAVLTDTSSLTSSINDQRDVSLDLFRLIWKAGIQYRKNDWKLGLTFTTPMVNVLGFANVTRDISVYNLVGEDSTELINAFAYDRQTNLHSTRYRTPFSIGFGVEKRIKKSLLMFSAEYFHRLKQYQVVVPNPDPFLRPSTIDFNIDETEFLSVIYAADPVLNFAVGYEYALSDKYTIHCSLRTDFSALDEDLAAGNEIIVSNAYWDLYHATFGVSLRKGSTLTTVGLNYSLGFNRRSDNLERFDRPDSIFRGVAVEPIGMKTSVHALAIIIGFTYYSKRG